MEKAANAIPRSSMHKLLIGSIVPRAIGWISTINTEGHPNLAPFSFFTAINAKPPHLLFCPGVRGTDANAKDTLNNVRATGEFVVNIVTEDLAGAMNITATEFPGDVDEFAAAGLAPAPSLTVRPPRVAASPIHFECRVTHIVDLGDEPGGASVVIGQILHVHVADDLLIGEDKIDLARLKPIGRLAGPSYCRVTDVFDLIRPPSQVQPK